ncbi:MAG: hypothetical protein OEY79_01095 [Anaplasmataceae bacterium]|nr:hypothetical protein [Anaplasmataceae bacterium]
MLKKIEETTGINPQNALYAVGAGVVVSQFIDGKRLFNSNPSVLLDGVMSALAVYGVLEGVSILSELGKKI